ncbi:MAG: hypothetical protein O3A46_01190 [Candidatus Poribacteria bacterium]|nr:hypothetical protein [Candidatus Poribacteria bacterium]
MESVFKYIFLIVTVSGGLLMGLAALIYDFQIKKQRLTGSTSKRDIDELRDEVLGLREELRDVHELLADLTLMIGDSERKALSRDMEK